MLGMIAIVVVVVVAVEDMSYLYRENDCDVDLQGTSVQPFFRYDECSKNDQTGRSFVPFSSFSFSPLSKRQQKISLDKNETQLVIIGHF